MSMANWISSWIVVILSNFPKNPFSTAKPGTGLPRLGANLQKEEENPGTVLPRLGANLSKEGENTGIVLPRLGAKQKSTTELPEPSIEIEKVNKSVREVEGISRNRWRKMIKKENELVDKAIENAEELKKIIAQPQEEQSSCENLKKDEVIRILGMLKKIKENEETAGKPIGVCKEAEKKWVKLSIAIDSGACDSVIDPRHVPYNDLIPTTGSANGEDFQSATGEPIENLGELRLGFLTREQSLRGMTFTGAPVSQPLGSVKRLCSAGHLVVFDSEYSCIINKATGETNMLRESEGNYMLDVIVAPPGSSEYNSLSFGRQA